MLDAGCWMLVASECAGASVVLIGYWLLAIGCWLLAVGYGYSSFPLSASRATIS